ncbi:hypothetical protein XELAEV_18006133mg [Xenopus laevis]|uniref:Uncharacterized protein n=1 Tax=Xenopus laevis TaxID=8355 RepID=A0A974DYQ3_XENLA|nr:hypothetical protein XELAEV_18006133mg [Xenopus laevis]
MSALHSELILTLKNPSWLLAAGLDLASSNPVDPSPCGAPLTQTCLKTWEIFPQPPLAIIATTENMYTQGRKGVLWHQWRTLRLRPLPPQSNSSYQCCYKPYLGHAFKLGSIGNFYTNKNVHFTM